MIITNQQLIIEQLKSGSLALTYQAIRDIIASHDRARCQRLWDYYRGQHDILSRQQNDPTKPNNRLVNDYPGEIVDSTVGYFIGTPVKYSSEDDSLLEAVNQIRLANDEELHNETIVREMCVTGKAYELLYVNEESQPRWMKVPATEMVPVYDGSNASRMIYALRYYPIWINRKEATRVELYDADQVTYYIMDGGSLRMDDTEPTNPLPHWFGEVPVVEYRNGETAQGDFEKVMTLIDDYNKRLSDNSNELEYFRNAYLVIRNMMGTEKEDLVEAKQLGAFMVNQDGEVSFLTKDINDAVQEHHFDRLDKNIHKFSKTPDLTDEKFASNLSGVAIRYKLFELETKCISKERCMKAGLRRRWQLVSKILNIKGKNFDASKLEMSFTRNIPANVVEIADMVTKLKGIVSDETLLAQLPFVADPAAEIEKRQKEQTSIPLENEGLNGDEP